MLKRHGCLAAAFLASSILFVLWLWLPNRSQWQFEAARRHWQERPFERYEVQISRSFVRYDLDLTLRECQHTLAITGNQITRVVAGVCAPQVTVDELFDRFAPYVHEPVIWGRCNSGNTCSCAVSEVFIEYDEQSGYPLSMRREWRDARPGADPLWRELKQQLPRSTHSMIDSLANLNNRCREGVEFPPDPFILSEEFKVLSLRPID